MFEQGVDSFTVSENKSENSFRVAMFEGFVKFFSHVIARETIVGETYVVVGGFFCVCGGDGGENFV